MCKIYKFKYFKKNNLAIAEEFTSLPALSIIMIGFTLFVLLIANIYSTYESKIESIDKYQLADFIINKLINPDCFFIKPGLIVDYPLLKSEQGIKELNLIQAEYNRLNVNFSLRLNWNEEYIDFPNELPNTLQNKIAISRTISIYFNEVETIPGKLTLILWNLN